MQNKFYLVIFILLGIVFCSGTVWAQPPCGAKVESISHPETAPTDGLNNFFVCESGVTDIAYKHNMLPIGNQPDNLYIVEFSNGQPLEANDTGTWNTVEKGLEAGDSVFITALTFDIDSVNGLLDKTDAFCPLLLNLWYPDYRPCDGIEDIQDGKNDGVPGVQTLQEVISIAELVTGEKLVSLKNAIDVLKKLNTNIKPFGGQVCFDYTGKPLVVLVEEDGAECLQGDIDKDLIANTEEDTNGNGDLTDDDLDKDGIPNYLDEDDNGDGILTKDHDIDGNGNPADDDEDGDGIADYSFVAIQQYEIIKGIYPNPNQGIFDIILETQLKEVALYNFEGKQVDFILNGNRLQITGANPGIYLLSINQQFSAKVMVQ